MTLVEILVALAVLALAAGGIFATLLQSRRLTEGSVVQNSALTIVQGYVEQIKNMELVQVVGGSDTKGNPSVNPASFAIPTRRDSTTIDALQTSTGTPPLLSEITPGITPRGVVDNLRAFDTAKDATASDGTSSDSTTEATAKKVRWTDVWPGARNYPAETTIGATDLKLNIWVWVADLSGTTTPQAQKAFGITLIYTWQFLDGGQPKYIVGTVRTIRSTVPTF